MDVGKDTTKEGTEKAFEDELLIARRKLAERYKQLQEKTSVPNSEVVPNPNTNPIEHEGDERIAGNVGNSPLVLEDTEKGIENQTAKADKGKEVIRNDNIGEEKILGGGMDNTQLGTVGGQGADAFGFEDSGNWWEQYNDRTASNPYESEKVTQNTGASDLLGGHSPLLAQQEDRQKGKEKEENENEKETERRRSGEVGRQRRMEEAEESHSESSGEEEESEESAEEGSSDEEEEEPPAPAQGVWETIGSFFWGSSSSTQPKPEPKQKPHKKTSRLRKIKRKIKKDKSQKKQKDTKESKQQLRRSKETVPVSAPPLPPRTTISRQQSHPPPTRVAAPSTRRTQTQSHDGSGYPGETYRATAPDARRSARTPSKPREAAEDSWVLMDRPGAHQAGRSRTGSQGSRSATVRVEPETDEEMARRLQRQLEEEDELQRRKDEEYARQIQRQLEEEAVQGEQQTGQSESEAAVPQPQNLFGWFTPEQRFATTNVNVPPYARTYTSDNGRVHVSMTFGDGTHPRARDFYTGSSLGELLRMMVDMREAHNQQRQMQAMRRSQLYSNFTEEELRAIYGQQAQPSRSRRFSVGRSGRSNSDMSYEGLVNLAERVGSASRGTNANLLQALPTRIYERTDKHSPEEDKCSICLAEYETGDELRALPCMHSYHKDCIDHWLKSHKTCPVCKYSLG